MARSHVCPGCGASANLCWLDPCAHTRTAILDARTMFGAEPWLLSAYARVGVLLQTTALQHVPESAPMNDNVISFVEAQETARLRDLIESSQPHHDVHLSWILDAESEDLSS